MHSFKFKNILPIEQLDLHKNLLWILHATKIPPHIGISADGSYFSLKVSGKDQNLKVENVIALARKKSLAIICIEINHHFSSLDINRVFSNFSVASSNAATCLSPIKKILEFPDAQQLSDLLLYLEEKHTLGKIFGLNLPFDYECLPNYSATEIQQRLIKLENAQRKKSLS